MERRITDDIDKLKQVLPTSIIEALEEFGDTQNLLEVVMDLGRLPTARYVDSEIVLSDTEITRDDLEWVLLQIGDFDADNRAGIERTLHRISGIRNRRGAVVGLTCRVGRSVYGTIDIIEDLVTSGESLLMLGPPGVGKTTMLREAARVLAEDRRVVIVDTSNEIGGDGDVPHPAVGKARRMQVNHPERQHEVMIEAVENHNPEVIIIDEIGRELEAMAARTIAERGVQLVATAHGNTLENLMLNPTLSDLVGGIQSVTLSDDEARRRGTQKTVLERRSPPTFDILVELQTRDKMAVHEDIAAAVDGMLRYKSPTVQVRDRDEDGIIHTEEQQVELDPRMNTQPDRPRQQVHMVRGNKRSEADKLNGAVATTSVSNVRSDMPQMKVYAYGVARNRLHQAAKRLRVPLEVIDDFGDADAVVTLKNYYRRRPKVITDAERRGMPIYVLRANTVSQMENFLTDVYRLGEGDDNNPFELAVLEAEQAIMRIRSGEDVVALDPQAQHIRKQQHDLARKANLFSKSYGKAKKRHVRFFADERFAS
ncbi:MAG: AAA family ATPase [Chloroflexota bacterium]